MAGQGKQSTPARVVNSDGSTAGFVWHGHLDDENADSLYNVMYQLVPTDFVSSDTSILDAIDLFSDPEKEYLYVIEKTTS